MRKIYLNAIVFLALACGLFLTSCSSEEVPSQKQSDEVPLEVRERFKTLGFNPNDIVMSGDDYLVEGDIIITPEALSKMGQPVIVNGPQGEQYRTYNLVSAPRTIRVATASGVSTKISNAVNAAIANFNSQNLTLTFVRVTSSPNITVRQATGSAGGVAGFPSGNGNPYNSVTIYSGTNNYAQSVVNHVVTHELGHCIGFRHSDWFNRSLSCGTGGSEGASSYGAVHISGTPTGFDASSVMNSCFSSSSSGQFSTYDRAALNSLY